VKIIKSGKNTLLKLYLSIITILSLLASSYPSNAFGHNSQSDDSITFLTLLEKTQTELELAKKKVMTI
jgi:hypothetical protein